LLKLPNLQSISVNNPNDQAILQMKRLHPNKNLVIQ
jgi:hypothetical protein